MAGEARRGTLGARLRSARTRRFVGREEELSTLRGVLDRSEPAIVWIFAPGGTGKSTLLREMGELARTEKTCTVEIDLSSTEASPTAILGELEPHLTGAERVVLLIDSYERGMAIDGWVRETLLPVLPDDVILVIAGRNPPSVEWRTDPGSASLLRIVALGSLDPAASRTLLADRGIKHDQAAELVALAHGHALTLVLLAEVLGRQTHRAVPSSLREVPEVVVELVARLVRDTRAAEERRALELCAHSRHTTESLLREIVGRDVAADLFIWLRALPYASAYRDGGALHSILRDALQQDLPWRATPGDTGLKSALEQHR
jgi:hypothetical protein